MLPRLEISSSVIKKKTVSKWLHKQFQKLYLQNSESKYIESMETEA